VHKIRGGASYASKYGTYTLKRTPWEIDRFAASQEIPRILWNPKAPLPHSQVPATCLYPEPALPPHPTSWRSTLILSFHLRLGLTSVFLPSGFPTKPYIVLSSPIRTTCPAHLILLDFIIRTILGEEYRSLTHCGPETRIIVFGVFFFTTVKDRWRKLAF
jgi:hypothetical protein